MEENRLQDIFVHLKKEGFDVRTPGNSIGECKGKFVVVKFDGESQHMNFSTNDTFYSLLCYVPQKQYSKIDTYIREIQKSMKKMEPMIMPTHEITSSFFDDNVKAWYVKISYKNYKRRL